MVSPYLRKFVSEVVAERLGVVTDHIERNGFEFFQLTCQRVPWRRPGQEPERQLRTGRMPD